ncbi:MAG TPA: 5-formyltetrahydrofolate cyclo-ligase [Spirochaetia bacterium]|nr:5-formyltetrahydrofolate cyclo-ligase [Spirochaetia bacterium]
MTKAELRGLMERVLADMDPGDLARRSARVAFRFQDTRAWRDARVVLCFLAMPHELDTGGIIRGAYASGKRVAVPRIQGDVIRFFFLPIDVPVDAGSLPRDRWGIPVPRPEWEPLAFPLDARVLVATPGLAFDHAGNRLGRGKGYYDRFLQEARAAAGERLTALGVCFSEQLVEHVPHTDTDQRLDGVVTDSETVTPTP